VTALDRIVFNWCSQFWPDVASTWTECRDYYRREYWKQIRKRAQRSA
jgi:hypothetical protein